MDGKNQKERSLIPLNHRHQRVQPCNNVATTPRHKNRVGSHSTMIQSSSKPIPIPLREVDINDDNIIAHETKHYDAATWRMYELITAARIRAASDNLAVYYKAVDLNREDSSDATTQLQQQRQRRAYSLPERPSVASPPSASSLTDGVFTMDSM